MKKMKKSALAAAVLLSLSVMSSAYATEAGELVDSNYLLNGNGAKVALTNYRKPGEAKELTTYATAWGYGYTDPTTGIYYDGPIASGVGATAWGGVRMDGDGKVDKDTRKGSVASGALSTAFGYDGIASGIGSTVWGEHNQAVGSYSTVWGGSNKVTGSYATAFGNANEASGSASTAWGAANKAVGQYATAWGNKNEAYGEYSTAFGYQSYAYGRRSLAALGGTTGTGIDTGDGLYSVALGWTSKATGNYAYAIGQGATATASNSVALGYNSVATETKTISVGDGSNNNRIVNLGDAVNENDAVTYKQLKNAIIGGVVEGVQYKAGANVKFTEESTGVYVVSLDKAAKITNDLGFEVTGGPSMTKADGINAGNMAITNVTAGTADTDAVNVKQLNDTITERLSKGSTATGENALALGVDNIVDGKNSTVVGSKNIVKGEASGAFGDPNEVYGSGSYVYGNDNKIGTESAPVNGSFAVGNNNNITGVNTFVLGSNVTTSANNSVILGNGSVATEDNVVSVGSETQQRKIVNVADGEVAEGSKEAVNGGQLWKVEQEIEGAIGADVSALENKIDHMGTRINKVGAGAAALAAMHPVYDEDSKLTFSAGLGAYRNEKAAAVGMFFRFSPRVMMNAGATVGNDNNMYNVGLNFALDRHVRGGLPSKAVMAKELTALRETVAQQDVKIVKLMAMLEEMKNK